MGVYYKASRLIYFLYNRILSCINSLFIHNLFIFAKADSMKIITNEKNRRIKI